MTEAEAAQTLATMGLTTAEGAATTATFSLSGAFKGLWATLKANPFTLVIIAVTAAISAYSAYKQKLEEARQAAIETADTAATLSDEIPDLTSRYLELSEAVKSDDSAKRKRN